VTHYIIFYGEQIANKVRANDEASQDFVEFLWSFASKGVNESNSNEVIKTYFVKYGLMEGEEEYVQKNKEGMKTLVKNAVDHTHNHLKWANLKFNEKMGNEQDPALDIGYTPPTPDFETIYQTLYFRAYHKAVLSSKD
jgi:hypothetical protein